MGLQKTKHAQNPVSDRFRAPITACLTTTGSDRIFPKRQLRKTIPVFEKIHETLSHLAVNTIAPDIARDFCDYRIPVVTSDVASGKTMLIPALCAQMLAQKNPNAFASKNDAIYVLMPKRNLANNAAENLQAILGDETGTRLIGCLNSTRSDDITRIHPENRIIFTTVGYALHANIIKDAKNFILDEAHEKTIELSLAKAILHHRRTQNEPVRIATMSATIDAEDELAFWGEQAKIYQTKGNAFPVNVIHYPPFSVVHSCMHLIEFHDSRGILVFVSGVEEIENAMRDLLDYLPKEILDQTSIRQIHGRSSGQERQEASAMPTKRYKILIGTNVLESGISLPWVDGGISSGTGKIMNIEGNIQKLEEIDLPQSRIRQQIGRTHRFKPGNFILHGEKKLEDRPEHQTPDILRMSLTQLVMQCAHFDLPLKNLKFAASETPRHEDIQNAIEQLKILGFITTDDKQNIHLTEDGRKISDLPLSFRSAAAYCEAEHLNILSQTLPLIALLEVDDIRKDRRHPLPKHYSTTSDLLNTMAHIYLAFSEAYATNTRNPAKICLSMNIAPHKLREYNAVLEALEKNLDMPADFSIFRDIANDFMIPEKEIKIMQVIFRAFSNDIYRTNLFGGPILRKTIEDHTFVNANIERNSCLRTSHTTNAALSGMLRYVSPRRTGDRPMLFLENITAFTPEQIEAFAPRFPAAMEILLEETAR